MSAADTAAAAMKLIRVGVDAAEGNPDPVAIAAAAIDVALQFVPVEDLRKHLDAAAIARAEAAADAIEDARFPR